MSLTRQNSRKGKDITKPSSPDPDFSGGSRLVYDPSREHHRAFRDIASLDSNQ